MLFVIHRLDASGKSSERDQHRDAHLAYLNSFARNILTAGPYTDPSTGQDRGSLFIVSFDNVEGAKAFAEDDPFTKVGIFSELQVWPWHQRVGSMTISDETSASAKE